MNACENCYFSLVSIERRKPELGFFAGFRPNHHAPRQARIRATHATSATDYFCPLCGRASRGSQGQRLHLSGSVLCHGLCAVDLPRILARYRSQLACACASAVSHGVRCQTISRNTLAHANATRPWQIYADLAQHLIGIARPLYAAEPFGVELDAAVYAFDASTIDLCLSVFAWAPFRSTKAAIKLHTLLDLRGNIPSFIQHHRWKDHESTSWTGCRWSRERST